MWMDEKKNCQSSYQTKEYYKYQHCLLVGAGEMYRKSNDLWFHLFVESL